MFRDVVYCGLVLEINNKNKINKYILLKCVCLLIEYDCDSSFETHSVVSVYVISTLLAEFASNQLMPKT